MVSMAVRQLGLSLLATCAVLTAVSCGGDVTTPRSTGSLAITASTSGPEPDADGYAVTIDGGVETHIAASGTIQRDNLEPGTRTIQLTGIALNCSVAGENPRPVTVTAGEKATTTFSVLCPTRVPYRVLDLGTLPEGRYASARDINSAGQVVGTSERPVVIGGTQPFLWENGVMIAITPGPDPDYYNVGGAAAINPAGQVVGVIGGVNSRHRGPSLWEQGVFTRLGPDGFATDINPAGQVVGCIQAPFPFDCHAFLWENGSITDLGTLGGESSVAYGIDPAGRVVGTSDGRAFLWENGVMTDLNVPGGESIARRINALGQVVGEVVVDGVTHGFIWEDGVTTDLGEVVQVSDINAGGQVVGWRNVETVDRAFVWEKGTMTDLPGPSRAFGINDEGQVVGDTGVAHIGSIVGARATLWIPE